MVPRIQLFLKVAMSLDVSIIQVNKVLANRVQSSERKNRDRTETKGRAEGQRGRGGGGQF